LERKVNIFATPEEMAEDFAAGLAGRILKEGIKKHPLTIALSGGKTPKLLFNVLANKYSRSVDWSHVRFFWVDERCVAPDDPESNYGMTLQFLLSRIVIPENNIHRIRGEDDPEKEASRYSEEIKACSVTRNDFPVVDLIILGMGDDGHTASVFPGNLSLFTSYRAYVTAVHPVSGQKRITMTGKVINNAREVIFMVTGTEKAHVIGSIFNNDAESVKFPAAHIVPEHGKLTWLLDKKAAEFII
jgi:6-phosphogluconolactonase